MTGIDEILNAVALAPDGSVVVTAGLDGHLVAREVPSGAERWRATAHSPGAAWRVDLLAFSPDGALVASAGDDARVVQLWDAATGRSGGAIPVRGARSIAFHPGEPVMVIAAGPALHVVEVARPQVQWALPDAHPGDEVSVATFSAGGAVLATVSRQGVLKIWEWPGLVLQGSVEMSRSSEPMAPISLALGGDAQRVAVNDVLGRVHVWDGESGQEERVFEGSAEDPGHAMRRSLAFTADGDWLLAPAEHGRGVRLLHVPTGKTYSVIRDQVPFYKAVSITLPAIALLYPGDGDGRGPFGLQVWRLDFRGQ